MQLGRKDFLMPEAFKAVEGGYMHRRNLDAAELVYELGDREPTAVERLVLSRYRGWGGISKALDPRVSAYDSFRAELDGVISEEMMVELRKSTPTAFYTPGWLARSIWDALMLLGLQDCNFLEPGCGSGNFIGSRPTDLRASVTGVETEPVAAAIAAKLYPSATILNSDLRDVRFSAGQFDAAVGNIPFANVQKNDDAMRAAGEEFLTKSLHNYFISRSVTAVRPGGIVALITSTYTLDSKGDRVRRWLAERCKMLAAIRLPADALLAYAGTRVAVDILIMQVRDEIFHYRDGDQLPQWVIAENARSGTDRVFVNRHIMNNEDARVGELEPVWNYGQGAKMVPIVGHRHRGRIPDMLNDCLRSRLQPGIYEPVVRVVDTAVVIQEKPETVRGQGGFFKTRDGGICQWTDGRLYCSVTGMRDN